MGGWTQRLETLSKCFGTMCFIYEIDFLPHFFTLVFLRKLLTEWKNQLQRRKYESRAQETKSEKTEAFEQMIILLNVLSSPSHPPWASFRTDFLIFLTCLEGACTLPLVSFHWTLNYCFQQLFPVFLYQLGACLRQFSNDRSIDWIITIEETNEKVEEKKVKNKSNPQMKVWWFWKSDMRCVI